MHIAKIFELVKLEWRHKQFNTFRMSAVNVTNYFMNFCIEFTFCTTVLVLKLRYQALK